VFVLVASTLYRVRRAANRGLSRSRRTRPDRRQTCLLPFQSLVSCPGIHPVAAGVAGVRCSQGESSSASRMDSRADCVVGRGLLGIHGDREGYHGRQGPDEHVFHNYCPGLLHDLAACRSHREARPLRRLSVGGCDLLRLPWGRPAHRRIRTGYDDRRDPGVAVDSADPARVCRRIATFVEVVRQGPIPRCRRSGFVHLVRGHSLGCHADYPSEPFAPWPDRRSSRVG